MDDTAVALPDAELLAAVKAALMGAPYNEIAQILRIDEEQVRNWILSPSWQRTKEKLWPEIRNSIHTELVGLRCKLVRQLAVRIEQGDPAYDKEGELIYKPLKARDLSSVLAQVSDAINGLEKTVAKESDLGLMSLDDIQGALRNLARSEVAAQNARAIPGERLN